MRVLLVTPKAEIQHLIWRFLPLARHRRESMLSEDTAVAAVPFFGIDSK